MYKYKVILPCSSSNQREYSLDTLKKIGGGVQDHKINFHLKEMTVYVSVQVENAKSFETKLTDLIEDVMIFSGSRGV